MSYYSKKAGWSDLNELRCLWAYKKLKEQGFPEGEQTKLAEKIAAEIKAQSVLSADSVNAKISDYKSVADGAEDSHASRATKKMFKHYGHLNSNRLMEITDKLIAIIKKPMKIVNKLIGNY